MARIFPLAAAVLAAASPLLAAEATQWRRWSFGLNVSNLSTSGSYGNNAAIVYTKMFGEDGIPATGDQGELSSCTTLMPGYYPDVDPFCDPRPDDLIAREGTIDDTIGFGATAAFELTRWFQLRFDARYYQSEVGPIDVYVTETIPVFHSNGFVQELDDRSAATQSRPGS